MPIRTRRKIRSPQLVPAPAWVRLLAPLLGLFLALPAAGQTRYLAFGDSITAGVGFDDCACQCPEECGYPARLETFLRGSGVDATVENHGLGGERTPEGLTRIDEVLAGAEADDVLLLMEGTNDITRGISPETTLFNLEEMARKASRIGVDTVHATLIPRYPDAWVDAENVLNEALARGIREMAFSFGRRLADPFAVFSGTSNLFDVYYFDPPLFDPVGHPNPLGFNLLAGVFFDVLTDRDGVPPVVAFVEPPDGAEEVSPMARIRVRVYDFGEGLDLAATRLLVNGVDVPVSVVGGSQWMDASYQPEEPLPSAVTARIEARDLDVPPNFLDREVTTFTVSDDGPDPCVPGDTTLCIDHRAGDRRFRVRMSWETAIDGGQSGQAFVTPLADVGLQAGGLFNFVSGNPEMLIKVLDGCEMTGHFWIFGAATTTLGFDLVVEDTVAKDQGAPPSVYEYRVTNEDGNPAQPFFDTEALDSCVYTP